tara:strand:- start:44 stop:268 length:225 start_codon:yes stop_codon:yes gene_type:complete
MYDNFPCYGNGVWVFGSLKNQPTEFLFYKEKLYTWFSFDDLGDMHRKVNGAKYTTPAEEIKNFPYKLYEEKCKR